MIRNFRALGLAIVAVLAMSAFMASAAQAKTTIKVTTSNSPVSIHAVTSSPLTVTAASGTIQISGS